jgi:hypothetical protein
LVGTGAFAAPHWLAENGVLYGTVLVLLKTQCARWPAIAQSSASLPSVPYFIFSFDSHLELGNIDVDLLPPNLYAIYDRYHGIALREDPNGWNRAGRHELGNDCILLQLYSALLLLVRQRQLSSPAPEVDLKRHGVRVFGLDDDDDDRVKQLTQHKHTTHDPPVLPEATPILSVQITTGRTPKGRLQWFFCHWAHAIASRTDRSHRYLSELFFPSVIGFLQDGAA